MLNNNRIVDVTDLGEALQSNASLVHLKLSHNQIVDVNTFELALKINTTLTSLNFHHNKITDIGGRSLGIGLKSNTTLKRLSLFRNRILDVSDIVDALKTNEGSALEVMALSGKTQSPEHVRCLFQVSRDVMTPYIFFRALRKARRDYHSFQVVMGNNGGKFIKRRGRLAIEPFGGRGGGVN
jgi:hypothetical protein